MILVLLCSSLLLYTVMDQGVGANYLQSLVTLSDLLENMPLYLIVTFLSQVLLIVVLTVAIMLFVSHKIAGPIYRYELYLENLLRGDLRRDVNTRQGDQLKPMIEALNGFSHYNRQVYRSSARLAEALEEELKRAVPDADRLQRLARETRAAVGAIAGHVAGQP